MESSKVGKLGVQFAIINIDMFRRDVVASPVANVARDSSHDVVAGILSVGGTVVCALDDGEIGGGGGRVVDVAQRHRVVFFVLGRCGVCCWDVLRVVRYEKI